MSSNKPFKIGDKVSVINDTLKGVIVAFENEKAILHDEYGFTREYKVNLLAKDSTNEDYKLDETELDPTKNLKIKQVTREVKLHKNEIDLHIENLIDSHTHMTNHEILTMQMKVCKRFIQKAIEANHKKIVLVHGKGEGVLKNEIHSYLISLKTLNGYKLEFHDASFQRFGIGGATEVIFH